MRKFALPTLLFENVHMQTHAIDWHIVMTDFKDHFGVNPLGARCAAVPDHAGHSISALTREF